MKIVPTPKTLALAAVMAGTGLAALPASATDILARVISSTPVVQQVAVPRQVCNNQAVVVQAPRSGAGALMGALAGGAAGNAIGNGGGRAAATLIGLVGGAMIGDSIEGGGSQVQNVQQCSTQTYYENRPSHYNVVYEYQSTQYTTQMATDPGLYVRLQVTPVGAIDAAPQPGLPAQPQAYMQPAPVAPAYVQQSTTYVQPAVYPAGPAYYGEPQYVQPYYPRPYFAPIGLSLNFGYSRGGGHGGHRGHWR